jgi:hypothetical protein
MNKLRTICLLALGSAMFAGTDALASSHREAPAIANDPAADNTDVWAWVSPGTHDKLYVVASYIPLEEPSGGPNFHKFSDDVLYEVHVAKGTSLNDAITYQIRFSTTPIGRVDPANTTAGPGGGKEFFSQLSGQVQTYKVTKIVGNNSTVIASGVKPAPVRIGAFTYRNFYNPGASGDYDDAYAATFIKDMGTEGRVWAGPRDDGFYVDLGGVFDAAQLRAAGTAQDGVAGFNCHTIALEIPTAQITGGAVPHNGTPGMDTLIGVWASASRRKVTILRNDGSRDDDGPWVQVSRLGLPLINEAVIGLQDKDKYNRTRPKTDLANFGSYILNPVVVRDAIAVGDLPQNTPDDVKYNRLDIVSIINLDNIPSAAAHALPLTSTADMLRLDVATDSSFPNGRPIIGGSAPNKEQADVTDILLSLLLTKGLSGVSDGVNHNDKNYLTTFPYLALPWDGATEGHGKPAP